MRFAYSAPSIIATALGMTIATGAWAGAQLFEGSWLVKAFGNEISGGSGEEEFYSAIGIPLGIQCNPNQPRCPYDSTPTDGVGNWSPLGGSRVSALFCAPWYDWGGYGATMRPAKGGTHSYSCSAGCGKKNLPRPPLYRNPGFFTFSGQPKTTICAASSTGYTPGGKGRVQAGMPVTGTWVASATGSPNGGFDFVAAPKNHAAGVRVTGLFADLPASGDRVYSYTYATLRNDFGIFGPGDGPGNFNIPIAIGKSQVASINVKQGAAKFGGTMRMLGGLTSKSCRYLIAGCLLGEVNWRYEAVGASVYTTLGGGITMGYTATYQAFLYHTFLMQISTLDVVGSRFPWTTGEVTVTARGRGPHETVHYAHGYDNRVATAGGDLSGTIQLVSPSLTRWLQPAASHETAGIGILRIRFIPEPRAWAMLAAGCALLAAVHRARTL